MAVKAKNVKVNLYRLISDAVDEGLGFGLNRAHKHTDRPSREVIEENCHREIMLAIEHVIRFGDE